MSRIVCRESFVWTASESWLSSPPPPTLSSSTSSTRALRRSILGEREPRNLRSSSFRTCLPPPNTSAKRVKLGRLLSLSLSLGGKINTIIQFGNQPAAIPLTLRSLCPRIAAIPCAIQTHSFTRGYQRCRRLIPDSQTRASKHARDCRKKKKKRERKVNSLNANNWYHECARNGRSKRDLPAAASAPPARAGVCDFARRDSRRDKNSHDIGEIKNLPVQNAAWALRKLCLGNAITVR